MPDPRVTLHIHVQYCGIMCEPIVDMCKFYEHYAFNITQQRLATCNSAPAISLQQLRKTALKGVKSVIFLEKHATRCHWHTPFVYFITQHIPQNALQDHNGDNN